MVSLEYARAQNIMSDNEPITNSIVAMATNRLRIEVLTSQHAQQVFEPLQDTRIYTYIPDETPPTIEALENKFKLLVSGPGLNTGERWLNWIMFLKDGPFPIGSLQATVSRSSAEIAYIVFPEYWESGFAKEGVVWLLNYLIEEEEVLEASATVDYRNRASIALIRSVGFKQKNWCPLVEDTISYSSNN